VVVACDNILCQIPVVRLIEPDTLGPGRRQVVENDGPGDIWMKHVDGGRHGLNPH
jgi:hypothetical protein